MESLDCEFHIYDRVIPSKTTGIEINKGANRLIERRLDRLMRALYCQEIFNANQNYNLDTI